MNDRLRDRLDDADPVLARAAELVASIPSIARSEARKERVRKAVLGTGSRRTWGPLLLRPGVAIAVLLVAGAVAAATIGRIAVLRTYHQLIGKAASPTIEGRAAVAPKLPVPAKSEASVEPAAIPGVVPAPVAPSAPVAAPAGSAGDAVRTSKAPTEAPLSSQPDLAPGGSAQGARAAPTQEAIQIMTAVRALRQEHDPARAGALLDDYLRRYPRGALAEEALGLAIEAASARGDARAAALARSYLEHYPRGRFLRAARAAAR
jgi:hypothetical protein